MIVDPFPILIPVKGDSVRCAGKNDKLLPYTATYLHKEGRASSVYVITDSPHLMELAATLNLKAHLEVRQPGQDELTSCKNYAAQNNIDAFFLCPTTQPFRSSGLLDQMENVFMVKKVAYDFITTAITIPDRRQYYVERSEERVRFKYFSKERKGSNCRLETMIDGAMYLIKTEFLSKVVAEPNCNEAFWKGIFTCIENKAPFMDIDTLSDMQKFYFLSAYFKKDPAPLFIQ